MTRKPQARVFEKAVICPVCAQAFKARVMRHHLFRKIHEDSDFCPYYQGSNPMLESVWVCPECHYAAAPKDFFDLTMEEKDAIARYSLAVLKDLDLPGRVRSLEDAIIHLQVACHCYEKRPTKVAQQGAHYLKTAWCYRYGRQEAKEREFLRLALERYRKVFEETHGFPEGLGEMGTAYLVGDLFRRLGQLEAARQWLALVVSKYPEVKPNHWIKRLARNRMEDIREALGTWENLNGSGGAPPPASSGQEITPEVLDKEDAEAEPVKMDDRPDFSVFAAGEGA